ncbi:hypothetical protein ACUN9V_10855 [Salinicola sp. V024]|uniref:hypothetical protein n=1 Tax=Salinicola TaxID=404432 RepID=UPI00094E6258|nr:MULTISPECIES: hypothetical protein [Salinicola]OLO08681.1 hypothetical protein BTW08_04995 [Salinicola sp. MH3R3-1]
MLQTQEKAVQDRPLTDDTGCCQMSSINLLDDSVSTQKEVQERNVMQLYLLTVQVRALMDVACHQGQAAFLTERLRFHTDQLEAQFSHLVDKHKGASYTRHFYAQQQNRFDAEIEKIIGALESLGEQYADNASR